MDFHLEYGLRFQPNPQYKNLYTWAINEIDSEGRQVGGDKIPWEWSLSFLATSCVLADSLEIGSRIQLHGEKLPATPPVEHRQVIRAVLSPGNPRDRENFSRQTAFSMLGTDRAIQDFSLEIHPIDNLAENERCTAWGTVAFTSEVDFRTETTADCVVFYLFVRSDRFLRYATQVAKGLVDEILLRVSRVPGLYSDWSPSVSTRDVKILTMGDEQAVALPSGVSFDLPRLGLIGSATLYFNRRIAWDLPLSEDTELQEPEKSGERVDIPIDRLRDPAALQSGKLDALVRLARFAVVLLALLCLIAFLKR